MAPPKRRYSDLADFIQPLNRSRASQAELQHKLWRQQSQQQKEEQSSSSSSETDDESSASSQSEAEESAASDESRTSEQPEGLSDEEDFEERLENSNNNSKESAEDEEAKGKDRKLPPARKSSAQKRQTERMGNPSHLDSLAFLGSSEETTSSTPLQQRKAGKSPARRISSSSRRVSLSAKSPNVTTKPSYTVKRVHFSPDLVQSQGPKTKKRVSAQRGAVRSTQTACREEEMIAHAQTKKMRLLASPDHLSKNVGMGAQTFNVPSTMTLSGVITGNLLLPPGCVKPTESVGESMRFYTMVTGQVGSVEVTLGKTTTPESEPTKNFFVSPRDMFQVPPGYSYRLSNNSNQDESYLTWTLVHPKLTPPT